MRIERVNDYNLIAELNEPVQNLHHELYPERFKKYNYNEVCKYFERIIDNKNHNFLVCFIEKEPVGYIWFEEIEKKETAFSKSSHYIYIQQVSVNENQRENGVGKYLFNEVLKFAEDNSIKRIGLDYWVKNIIAKQIYKKLGFELEKEITYLNSQRIQ
ncbi:GNAT family N-acetyltransferase [Clostridiaceae bacterium HSG29]|nr:GNAT family N-acetyltransferase [Clostridiaceae bacterium HSG29]